MMKEMLTHSTYKQCIYWGILTADWVTAYMGVYVYFCIWRNDCLQFVTKSYRGCTLLKIFKMTPYILNRNPLVELKSLQFKKKKAFFPFWDWDEVRRKVFKSWLIKQNYTEEYLGCDHTKRKSSRRAGKHGIHVADWGG